MEQQRRRWRTKLGIRQRARQLRTEMTATELILWRQLRYRQLNGARFRRQHAVGPFILDFFCPAANLAIEIDGDSHAEQQEYDNERSQWLWSQRGIRVIRFTNRDVIHSLDAVLEQILGALRDRA